MIESAGKYLVWVMQIFVVCIVLILPASLIYIFVFLLYFGESIEAQRSESTIIQKSCMVDEKEGYEGRFFLKTHSGLSFMLKTPAGYQARQAHPLLIVFAPAFNSSLMERYTGLTALSTQLGFIVAYVDGININLKSIPELVEVYEQVNERWCVDSDNIYLAGHSDGASAAQALAFLPGVNLQIKGVISSAAGIQYSDLKNYPCPSELNVMLLQNQNDEHFPDYSKDAIKWWASCNQCNQKITMFDNGCGFYQSCLGDVQTVFCEQPGNHLTWPGRHQEIKNFLKQGLLN